MNSSSIKERLNVGTIVREPFFLACLLVLGLGCLLYYPHFSPPSVEILRLQSEAFFFESNAAAGAPVLVLALWLFYRRSHYRDVFRGPGAPRMAMIMMFSAALVFSWGSYTGALDLQLISLIALLAGVVLMLGGRAGIRAYWLPILFIGFAHPISPVLLAATIYPVQLLTAEYAGFVLNAIGVVSSVQGDQIIRPENTFIVIETCSGIRTMVTLSMLTVLLIDLFERRGAHAAILLALAPMVAFLTNGLRVVTLVLNPASSIHSVHNLQGIAMLLVGLTAIYLIDGQLERFMGSRDPNADRSDYGLRREGDSNSTRRAFQMLAVGLLLIAMLLLDRFGPTWSGARPLGEKPAELLARVFGEDPSSPYEMDYNFVGSVHYLAHAKHRVPIDDATVDVHLGVANEQQRKYSILTKRLAWPATGYQPVEEALVDLTGADGPVRRMVLRRGARRVLSYSWIERRGGLSAEWFRQLAALDRSPFARPGHMIAIRLSTSLEPGASSGDFEADERIRQVWQRLVSELGDYAPTI